MSWSLQIRNGDLNPSGPAGCAIVTGQQKLVQDLRCALLEPLGNDPLHLDYGSTLDGGRAPDGTTIPAAIGMSINSATMLFVESEIKRVLNYYQNEQLNRLLSDQQQFGGKNTFSAGEILYSVDSVFTQQVGDTIVAQTSITTSDGTNVTLLTPVAS